MKIYNIWKTYMYGTQSLNRSETHYRGEPGAWTSTANRAPFDYIMTAETLTDALEDMDGPETDATVVTAP